MLAELVSILDERGIIMRGGSIVDATFVESPSSTKNRERSRDPEAHQAKKGNNWHFGYKAHAGVDAGTGLVHTVEVTAANVSDVAVAPSLLRPDDEFCYADAGYTGAQGRQQAPGHPDPSEVTWRIARRRSRVPGRDHPEVSWERGIESSLSRVRSKGEHPSPESETRRRSASTRSACSTALLKMNSETVESLNSAACRIAASCRSLARRLMRRVLAVVDIETPFAYVHCTSIIRFR